MSLFKRCIDLSIAFTLLLFLVSCSRNECPVVCPSQESAVPTAAKIKVFATNDVHGYALNDPKKGRIGYALLKGRMDRFEREGYRVFLVDSGDAFSGSAYAQFDSGRSIAALMGKMGYRVLEPGNHAFDYNQPEDNPLYYPNILIKGAKASGSPLDVVSSNLSRNGLPLDGVSQSPVTIYEQDGLRLVVAGVITPYVASSTNRSGLTGYDFGTVEKDDKPSHDDTRKAVLEKLAGLLAPYDRPGDVVLILSHVGYDDSDDYAHGQLSGRDLALVKNVDVVLDAHSHTVAGPEQIGTAYYANGGRYLENFSEITIATEDGGIHPVLEIKSHQDMAGEQPSPVILAAIDEITQRLGLGDELFTVPDDVILSDAGISSHSTPLGRFICRSMAEIAHADLALFNSGGIRSGLSSGRVTVGGVHNVTPFMNDLVSYSMTGEQILSMFNSLPARDTNGFPQFYGMTVYGWDEGGKLRAAGILDGNGKPLRPNAEYSVAINSFMAGGGDGFSFEYVKELNNYGDSATITVRKLRGEGDQRLDELRENRTLLLFPNETEAKDAWTKIESAPGKTLRKSA